MEEEIPTHEWEPNPYNLPDNILDFLPTARIRSGANVVPFVPYDYQAELLGLFDKYPNKVIFKDRQLGLTELIGARQHYQALTNPGFYSALISINENKASEVKGRVKDLTVKYSDIKWISDSNIRLQASGCGTQAFLPSTPDAARSLPSVVQIVIDEAAFIPGVSELYSAAVACQEMVAEEDREIIICSTMSIEGKNSWFWKLFSGSNGSIDAEAEVKKVREGDLPPLHYWVDDAGWLKIIVSHKVHPIYGSDPDYLAKTKAKNKITEEQLQREHNLAVPEGGESLLLTKPLIKLCTANRSHLNPDPEYYGRYFLHLDPAKGGNDDYTAALGHYENGIFFLDLIHPFDADHNNRVSIAGVEAWILDIHRAYGLAKCTLDQYNSQATIQRLENKLTIEELTWTSKTKTQAFSTLKELFTTTNIELYTDTDDEEAPCNKLVTQLEKLRVKYSLNAWQVSGSYRIKNGVLSYDPNLTAVDDYAFALAGCILTAETYDSEGGESYTQNLNRELLQTQSYRA